MFVILRLYESESLGCISAGLWHCYSVVGGYNMSENYYCHFQGHRFLKNVGTQLPERMVPQPRRLQYRNDTFIHLFSGTLNFMFFNIMVAKFPSSRTKALFKNP